MVDFDEELLEDDFENLVQQLVAVSGGCSGLMYRDFQSRNVMIKDGEPFLIDYQGARRGPSIYDAVSFLWQAKAGFRDEERMELLDYYQGCYLSYRPSANALHASAWLFVAFRTLQVLGAYGFRGLVEGKAHFIESLPPALATLKSLLDKGLFSGFPELEKACRNAISSPRLRDLPSPDEKGGPLNIDVYSFSYKKGYPKDLSGNGGGFMFDCRGMHNPGRYAEYKSLTGLDAPVRDFLKERGEADGFVKKALEIVIPSVETYLRRGFTRLQIGFGCTGGQHRSVYCAQEVGEALRKNYPAANIRIIHREQEGGKR